MLLKNERMAFMLNPVELRVRERIRTPAKPTTPICSVPVPGAVIVPGTEEQECREDLLNEVQRHILGYRVCRENATLVAVFRRLERIPEKDHADKHRNARRQELRRNVQHSISDGETIEDHLSENYARVEICGTPEDNCYRKTKAYGKAPCHRKLYVVELAYQCFFRFTLHI